MCFQRKSLGALKVLCIIVAVNENISMPKLQIVYVVYASRKRVNVTFNILFCMPHFLPVHPFNSIGVNPILLKV